MTTQFRDVAEIKIEYIRPDSDTVPERDKFVKPDRVTISDAGYVVIEEEQKPVGDDSRTNHAKTNVIPLSSIRKMEVIEIVAL